MLHPKQSEPLLLLLSLSWLWYPLYQQMILTEQHVPCTFPK